MHVEPDGPAVSRFSTDDLPERDRIAMTREFFGPKVVGVDFAPVSDAPFRADLTLWSVPGLQIVSSVQSAIHVRRTSDMLADGRDGFSLVVGDWQVGTVSQCGRRATIQRGDAYLWSETEPSEGLCPGASRILCLHIPRTALQALVSNVDGAIMRVIPQTTEALTLLKSYVTVLQEDCGLSTPELQHVVTAHVYDLVALALGATRDAAELARNRGVRAARLAAVKVDIIRNLGREELSVGTLADRHGLTPRYIQMLFETEGMTFSEFVLRHRIIRAQRLLTDPRFADWPISTIAYRVGFGDLSYFNRSFRRVCGMTPSELRTNNPGRRSREEAGR